MKKTTYQCDGCKKDLKEGAYYQMIEGKTTFLLKSMNDHVHKHYCLSIKLGTTSQKNLEREFCADCLLKMIIDGANECYPEKSSQ